MPFQRPARGPWPWLLAGLCVSACQGPLAVPVGKGALRLKAGLGAIRTVQYLASQVAAIRVTLTDTATGVSQTFDDLAPQVVTSKKSGTQYTFAIQNITTGTYTVTLTVFADTAESLAIGSITSSPFTVSAGATATLSVPSLTLDATPVGTWTIDSTVTSLPAGTKITSYSYTLTETDGTSTTKTFNSSLAAQAHTWSNVIAYPAGTSTCSVTVTGTYTVGHKKTTVTSTSVATGSIVGGSAISSSLTL